MPTRTRRAGLSPIQLRESWRAIDWVVTAANIKTILAHSEEPYDYNGMLSELARDNARRRLKPLLKGYEMRNTQSGTPLHYGLTIWKRGA